VDDAMHDHRKFRGRSLAAIGLWTVAGAWCGDNRTDGFVPEAVARRWPGSRKLACELVAAGLWENTDHDGERGWRFHDWSDWQPTKDEYSEPSDKIKWRRKKQLERNGFLREQIHERDRGLCRYCGVRVNWSDKRGATGGTYDHVDPAGGNELENVVTACRRCNGRKRDRTPVEAGMVLLPVPAPFDSGSEQIAEQVGAGINPLARETGRGVNRGRSDLAASEQVGAVPVQVGSGPSNGNGAHE
jgi:hypothetical protein